MTSGEAAFHEIGWNGIRFLVPADWEIRSIGKQYLFFESNAIPVLEVKWDNIKGTFSHQKHLRRLARLQKNLPANTLKEQPMPPGWKDRLARYEATCFSWRGEKLDAMGLILFCPRCRKASLIQFFKKNGAAFSGLSDKIVTSFQDHPTVDHTLWRIYDIKAVVPNDLHLTRYRFVAGAFELGFAAPGLRVVLYRWGPASVLLRYRSMEEFACRELNLPQESEVAFTECGLGCLQGRFFPSDNFLHRFVGRLQRTFPFKWFQIWHVAENNRILCVKIESKKAISFQRMNELCARYETL